MPPLRFLLYLSTVGVLAMTAWTVLMGPPPMVTAATVLVAYAALVFGGVFVLRWRVFVDAIVRGPRGGRGVVLTFDDGPHPKWTPRVLDLLDKRGVKATFFVIARKAEEHPEIVKAILDRGHAIGMHSYAHDRLFALRSERRVFEDLSRALQTLEGLTGHRPALFRPPIGHTNPIVARVVDALDLVVVGWSVSGHDGVARARVQDVVARVKRDLRDRAIVLLHDAPERGEREPAAIRALPAILDAIAAERLEVVPLSRWIGADGGAG